MKNENELKYIQRETDRLLDYIKLLESTRGSIHQYRDEIIDKYSWDVNKDIRINILNQIDSILIAHASNLYFNIKYVVNHSIQNSLFKVTTFDEAKSLFEGYTRYNKNALIYNLSAVVERFLRLIVMELDSATDISTKFYNIKQKVFKNIDIPKDGNEWIALTLLSSIRNTIHNNGIYVNNNDQSFTYRGAEFTFKNNFAQNYANYENLNTILLDILSLIRGINNHSSILSKDSFIDEYKKD